jgi:hypothetical protein
MPEYIYHRPVPYQVEAAETLREIGDRPHMLLRIGIRGGHFPHRDAPAFARLESQGGAVEALFCEVDDDEAGLRAYFPTDVALEGRLVVGFEGDLVAEFALDRLRLEPARLDEQRIEGAFHRVTLGDLGGFKRRE